MSHAIHRSASGSVMCLVVALTGQSAVAESLFHAKLEIDLAVDTPVITNKFGFATSFPTPPKPPGGGARPTNPDGDSKESMTPDGAFAVAAERYARTSAPGMKGLSLEAIGFTDAVAALGSKATGEAWATGRTKVRLGNFTGRSGLPPAEEIEIDLSVHTDPFLRALAGADAESWDWASAKYHFELINADSGAVLLTTPPAPVMPIEQAESGDNILDPAPIAIPTKIKLAPNSFTNVELVGHVYASGYSIGNPPAFPPVVPPPAMAPFEDRSRALFPDDDMLVSASPTTLLGDANNQGRWLLAGLAGVNGADPDAHAGMATVMLDQTVVDPQSPNDLLIEVEAPLDGMTTLAMDQLLLAPGGVQMFGLEQVLGVGVADDFMQLPNPQLLSFMGPASPLPPQPLHGSLVPVGFDDDFAPSAIFYEGMLGAGQTSGLLSFVQVHDLVDGQLDGMARFTVRQLTEGHAGDYNMDGMVDEQDYQMWSQLYGSGDILADGNGDGAVDAADYTLWRDRLGGGHPEVALGNSAAPEPTAVAICLLAAASAVCVRRP